MKKSEKSHNVGWSSTRIGLFYDIFLHIFFIYMCHIFRQKNKLGKRPSILGDTVNAIIHKSGKLHDFHDFFSEVSL